MLVTAIVVVLPMVLDSEPRPVGPEVTVQIPSPDSGAFTSKVVPLAEAPAAKPPVKAPVEGKPVAAAPAPEEKKAAAATPAPAPKAETSKPAPKKKGPTRKARKEPAKPAAKAATGQFAVQVIALADAEKARQMQGRIAAAGINSYTEVVKTVKGEVTRVRAGPFDTREAAEKAREQLKTIGLTGNITPK
ncbi:MAG: SPOR domain-containing protein [Betaproteobacteria bacterium]|nr:SPOR domain-containing protein [Betaproteobacteria bacterium]